jgi:hypothetical protein
MEIKVPKVAGDIGVDDSKVLQESLLRFTEPEEGSVQQLPHLLYITDISSPIILLKISHMTQKRFIFSSIFQTNKTPDSMEAISFESR